jgi:3-phenylpropionate/trans-cinnamate dioxygenase ferredoxin subunit
MSPLTGAGFERVASVAELPEGTLMSVKRSSGEAVCLFNHGGRIGAMADRCTHQAFPLSQGSLQPDGTVQCSWHGARFDCTSGSVREGPAMDPVPVYETRVHDGGIWIGAGR